MITSKQKLVWETQVVSRNFISDFGAELKNIIGGRLTTYEKMINSGIEECSNRLCEKYPAVKNIKMQITEFANKSVCITVYGVINAE
jgi:uncharacterized protein YbjQ (UPF0145 family)